VAAALVLTACGGGDGDTGSRPPEGTDAAGGDAEGTTGPSGTDEFCDQAAGIDQRVDAAMSDLDGDDPSVPEAFRQIAAELRDITAPPGISSDWSAMATGLDRMADAFAEVDITDLSSLESLDEAEGDLTAASDHVDTYLRDECGI
jgi:hypothetical protein